MSQRTLVECSVPIGHYHIVPRNKNRSRLPEHLLFGPQLI